MQVASRRGARLGGRRGGGRRFDPRSGAPGFDASDERLLRSFAESSAPAIVATRLVQAEPRLQEMLDVIAGSESAAHAIRAAGALCSPRSAIVLNVWEPWVRAAPVLAGVARPVNAMTGELDEIATELSDATAAEGVRLAAEAGFEARPVSARSAGSPWRSLLDLAEEHDAEALVLGKRGLTGVSRVLGSVSNGVAHHSRRPVLVVPGPSVG